MGIMQLKSSEAAKQAPAKKVKKISFKENKQEIPAVDTEKIKADAELFNDLMTKAIEMRKFKPGDTRLETFSAKCEYYASIHNNAIPDSGFVVSALKDSGVGEIAEAFEKALAGIDLDIAVAEMPDIEEAPADEEPVGDKEPTDADKPEDNPPLNEDLTEQPVDGTTQASSDEATAVADANPETEAPADETAPRRAGRPRKNA